MVPDVNFTRLLLTSTIGAGDLVYVYDKDTKQQAQFLLAQATYLAAIEELTVGGVHKHLWPLIERLIH